ncbi:hypothetical protein COE88_28745, partial [Bacillus toyonensis]
MELCSLQTMLIIIYSQLILKQKLPTPAKYKAEFKWLKEVDSLTLANAQLNLQTAYKNFFSGQNDFPTFKSKKDR